ncbi:KxYKxGKxW signal peptide domain-containing protein [Leuconostoc pseudomesenteroides]|uniref:KxYKxGKxW signal peptide domain-containing protein n=1 Tax=Leuconostoc pseudomesenteroides TaxID=33968 RepID=UPI0032DE2D16
MTDNKRYKLYKDGKKWVVGAIAVAGVSATLQISSVSADTTSQADATTTQPTTSSGNAKDSQTDTKNDAATETTTDSDSTTPAVVSDISKSVSNNATQTEAKQSIDSAQETVNKSVQAAQEAGVEVKTNPTKEVTLNNDNTVSESNKVLTDLNAQDQAVKQATETQKANTEAYNDSTAQRDEAVQKGESDLAESTAKQDEAIKAAQEQGLEVSVQVTHLSPEYQSLTGLTGKALLDAMAANIKLYNDAVAQGVSNQNVDTATLQKLTAEYQAKYAAYATEKARVEKSNADKKAAYDKLVLDRETAIKAAVDKGDQHYTGTYDLSGYYGGFLKGKLHYDYTYHWDATKNTFIITKVDMNFESATPDKKGNGFWDAVYIQGPKFAIPQDSAKGNIQYGADLKENGNTLWDEVKDTKYGVQFFLAQNNKTGETVTHQTLSSSVPYEAVQLANGEFEFARFISRNRQGDSSVPNSEYANWMIGNRVLVQLNIPPVPDVPTYEDEPIAPDKPELSVQRFTVVILPEAEAPDPLSVTITPYLVKLTPDKVVPPTVVKAVVKETVKPAEEVAPTAEKPVALPETNASQYTDQQVAMVGVLTALMGIGLVGARRQYQKNDNAIKPKF